MNRTQQRHRHSFFPAVGGMVMLAIVVLSPTAGGQPAPAAAAPYKPCIFLIGDSTIRNGTQDNGATAGQFGWGHMFHYYFDTSRIYVVNDAMGGTSSASFQKSPNLWPNVIKQVQPGDFVLMAFGHNDSRGSLKGNGEDTQDSATGVMHSFGWYMRQYIQQTRAKGATPIVLSLIPRNRWSGGKVSRNTSDYALWARQAAEQEKVDFIPLNDIIADKYDMLGMAKVQAELFPPNEAVHPNWAGAKLNAECVVEGIKALKGCPLNDYLLKDPKCPEAPDVKPPARGEMGPTAMSPVGRAPKVDAAGAPK